MRYQRDKRRKKWPGLLRGRAGEGIPVTFDPQFWDREVKVGDRRTVFVEPCYEHKLADYVGREPDPDDVYFSMMLGKVAAVGDHAAPLEGWGPVVHAGVLAIYEVASREGQLQVEIKITNVHEPEPAIDPYAEVPDGS